MLISIETIDGGIVQAGIRPPELQVRLGGELPPVSVAQFAGQAAITTQPIWRRLHDDIKNYWAGEFERSFDGLDDVRLLPEDADAESGPAPFYYNGDGNVHFFQKGAKGHMIRPGNFLRLASTVFEDISGGSQPAISPKVLAAAGIIRQTIKNTSP